MPSRFPPRLFYTIAALITLPLGTAVRFAHAGLPAIVTKYGGSALWAMAIFWLLSILLPSRSLRVRATIAWLLATAIEFFKLIRSPALDAFRLTLPGKLLLGRIFSLRDLFAYTAAILLAATLDRASSRIRLPDALG